MKEGETMKLTIEVNAEQLEYLKVLGHSPALDGGSPEDVLSYLVRAVCDGVRRPGSWERQCVISLFGTVGLPASYAPPGASQR